MGFMDRNMIAGRVPQAWLGVALYLTKQLWHRWNMGLTALGATGPTTQPPTGLAQLIQGCVKWGNPLSLAVWERCPLLLPDRGGVWCSLGHGGGRVKWCTLKWSSCLSQCFSLLSERFFCFQNLFFEIKNKSEQNCTRGLCCILKW